MANDQKSPETGKFLRKYSEEAYDIALGAYEMYGSYGASQLSGIPIASIKVEAKKRGIRVKDGKTLEKQRATIVESRRAYIRGRMLDLIERTIERMTSPYPVPVKVNPYEWGTHELKDGPPAKDFEKFASALEKLVELFRLEAGEPNNPIIRVGEGGEKKETPLMIFQQNLSGLDPEARERAASQTAQAVLAKITGVPGAKPEEEVIEGEVVDEPDAD